MGKGMLQHVHHECCSQGMPPSPDPMQLPSTTTSRAHPQRRCPHPAQVLAGLPLPIFYCWVHLCLMACKLRLWPVARRAAGVLFPQFITTTPDRPLWEANPMDAQVMPTVHLRPTPCMAVWVRRGGQGWLNTAGWAAGSSLGTPVQPQTIPGPPSLLPLHLPVSCTRPRPADPDAEAPRGGSCPPAAWLRAGGLG